LSRLTIAILVLGVLTARAAFAQTPSPLQQWQYSGGIPLEKLFQPDLPEWQVTAGVAAEVVPVYEGARASRVEGGPVINIRYQDIFFVSTGEGVGVNLLRGDQYRAGVALGYDLGRRLSADSTNLRGVGGIAPAPVTKLFASYVLSKTFPVVIQADAREILGGSGGGLADLGLYIPLPGSSRRLVMFLGPSIEWADERYLRSRFGVTLDESLVSDHAPFDPHGGTHSLGLGFSAAGMITDHWLLNVDAAISVLRGSAASSPLTEARTQRALALSVDYTW
jgi:outer membrane scaffolding protein for murein synthesis (MipA/OmpV family)